MPPEDSSDELEESDDMEGARLGACGLAVQEEIEELETDGMTLDV